MLFYQKKKGLLRIPFTAHLISLLDMLPISIVRSIDPENVSGKFSTHIRIDTSTRPIFFQKIGKVSAHNLADKKISLAKNISSRARQLK